MITIGHLSNNNPHILKLLQTIFLTVHDIFKSNLAVGKKNIYSKSNKLSSSMGLRRIVLRTAKIVKLKDKPLSERDILMIS